MVITMRHLLAAFLLLLTASAEAQQFGSSTVETSPATLTVSGATFTPACPTLGGTSSGVNNIVVTAASQSIAMPTCPGSSVGLFATFNICNGKGGTAPCNGTASGPFSPGVTFGSGFEFPTTPGSYNETQTGGAKDIVTCEVMGTTGPWSCGTPQYALSSGAWALVAAPAVVGAPSNATTAAFNMTAAAPDLLVAIVSTFNFAPAISDSAGNTWTAGPIDNAQTYETAMFFVHAPALATNQTFTCVGVSNFCTINVQGWQGSAASPLDVSNHADAANVSNLQTGSITPTKPNTLVIAGLTTSGGAITSLAIDSGFTLGSNQPYTASTFQGGAIASLVQTSGALNPNWSWAGLVNAAAVVADFSHK